MKKFLVVLLALAMVFALATTAMAADTAIPDYSDVNTATQYASDIYRLTSLGVLQGNTGWGGAYRPADNLTRAEFAKIAVYMFGKQDTVAYYAAQKSAFSDVAEGNWAEGYINCAYDNGLMVGVGGGKFAPNAPVTKQEVATVVLRAVGYTDELPGAWPADYIAKSQKVIAPFTNQSLFAYVQKIDGTAASRAEMAAIVNYALGLYRVEYVGNQLMVQGLSTADADGYSYKALNTNEADIYNFFLGIEVGDATINLGDVISLSVDPNLTTRETLMWDVFHAFTFPYLFNTWDVASDSYVEAAGWGFEDFDKCELVFQGSAIGAQLPVASNYYIYDDSLDGELWNVGGRLAAMTIKVDVDKVKVANLTRRNLAGLEAVYAELLTDVEYIASEDDVEFVDGDEIDLDNGDLFSLDLDGFLGANVNGNYDFYDYDWFLDEEMGIVDSVEDDMVTVDNWFGEDGEFCLLDDCKKHDQDYVFLKDGKLQDASCLKLDDVVYYAGDLAGDDAIELYIVYSPKAGTFDALVNGISNGHNKIELSGDEYLYCRDDWAHAVSYDGGYAADGDYDEMIREQLRAQLTDDDFDGSCLYTVGYGKLYVASLIFEAEETTKGYGVLTDTTEKHISPDPDNYYAVAATIFGADGKETDYDLSDEINVGYGDDYTGDDMLGDLFNYELNEDGEIDTATDGDGDFETFGAPGSKDVGYVALAADLPIDRSFHTDARGFFASNEIGRLDAFNDYSNGEKSFADMKITEDTIIFEITTDGGEFDEVALGDASKYIDATFQARQINIFAWSGSKITVLYVVDSTISSDEMVGLFTSSGVTASGDYLAFEDGTKLYFSGAQIADLPAGSKFYGIYRMKDNEISRLYEGPNAPLKPGDFDILIDEDGLTGSANATRSLISEYRDDVASVIEGDVDDVSTAQLTADTEYIDMTDDDGFEAGYFDRVDHEDDEYGYVVFANKYGEILAVFRCYGQV